MRFIVFGAGAVGGVVGGLLARAGEEVCLIARGAHLQAIRKDGLRLETPEESRVLRLAAFEDPRATDPRPDDVVLLAVKSQDTREALASLARCFPPSVAVVCMQNGVDNEREALRLFPNVYAVPVWCPATYLDEGVVHAHSSPIRGVLDVGRYPRGEDRLSVELATRFSAAGFRSVSRPDIMRYKWSKLLFNLTNSAEALCDDRAAIDEIATLVRSEAEACFKAAGIDYASASEDAARRGQPLAIGPTISQGRTGGSSWQSLARGTGNMESDYLNGEVILLGRLSGTPTPVNAFLQNEARRAAALGLEAGSLPGEDLLARARVAMGAGS